MTTMANRDMPGYAPPGDDRLEDAYGEGFAAARRGEPESACPYEAGVHERVADIVDEWCEAWTRGHDDYREANPPPRP